jgi:hypothetical protein
VVGEVPSGVTGHCDIPYGQHLPDPASILRCLAENVGCEGVEGAGQHLGKDGVDALVVGMLGLSKSGWRFI